MSVRGWANAAMLSGAAAFLVWSCAAAAADAKAGAAVFETECAACHKVQPGKNLVGPTLFGVVGRVSGTVPHFHYSQANVDAKLTWTPEKLDSYLKDPMAVLPGTTMGYAGLADDTQRTDLIAYLATLK